jgi:hypothetical protein
MIFSETNEKIAMEISHLFSFPPFWQNFTQRKNVDTIWAKLSQ